MKEYLSNAITNTLVKCVNSGNINQPVTYGELLSFFTKVMVEADRLESEEYDRNRDNLDSLDTLGQ